jgi:hypothetical protein
MRTVTHVAIRAIRREKNANSLAELIEPQRDRMIKLDSEPNWCG